MPRTARTTFSAQLPARLACTPLRWITRSVMVHPAPPARELDERRDQDHDKDHDRHRRRISHLERTETSLEDQLHDAAGAVGGTAVGHDEHRLEDLKRAVKFS